MADVINLFTQARVVPPTRSETPTSSHQSAGDKEVVELGEDLSMLAKVKVLITSLEALKLKFDKKVKDKMFRHFTKVALATGKRPNNFKGVSSKAEASCELRKRPANSALTDQEVAILKAMEIPVKEEVVCEAIPERYFFNPDIVASEELAAKISSALAHIPELQGKELILKAPAEPARTRRFVPDEALDAVAATKDAQMIKELLPIVSCLAIRVKLTNHETADAMDLVKAAENKT